MNQAERTLAALNRLCKWRTVLAGWHLGSKAKDAPGVPAMRDLQDFRLLIRAEVSALTELLIQKGVFTEAEYRTQLEAEAVRCDLQWEAFFPGYQTTDVGVTINPTVARETNRIRGFPP
jgi:hypothetical protein